MNLPNKLTLFRMILVPFFVAAVLVPALPNHYLWALLLFLIASYTDHLDGKLARKYNQVTNFGKFLDPVADKIQVISALVCFVQLGFAQTWCVLLIIAREFIVTSIRLVAVDGGKVIAANKWGKTKTVSQLISISVILLLQYLLELSIGSALLFQMIGDITIYIATLLTVISGVTYVQQNFALIRTAK